jgi:hypothetical protein
MLEVPSGAVTAAPSGVERLVRAALAFDLARNRAADTLYALEAYVVANGRVRLGTPRFAGIGNGGRVTILNLTVTLQGRMAWALIDYRWDNVTQNQVETARATVICEEQRSSWRIVHVHSSQLLPWDR